MFRFTRRVLAAAVSSACVAASVPAFGWSLNISGATCQNPTVDGNGNISINCSGTQSSSCTLTPSTSSLPSSGGQVTLMSNCGAVASWSGAKSTDPGTRTSFTDTLPANASAAAVTYMYSITGSNGTASTSVTVAGVDSTPTPPVGSISCANIPGITGKTQVVPVGWKIIAGLVSTQKYGSFNANDAFVFAFTPPAGTNTGGKPANFSISPTNSSAYNNRLIAISDTPCDFSGKLGPGSVKLGQEPNVYFTVDSLVVNPYTRTPLYANLASGHTYYVTVIQQNSVGGTNTCASGTCDVNFGLSGAGL